MSRRRLAAVALTVALALLALVLLLRGPEATDASAVVALAAADWARRGGDPATCVGVPGEGAEEIVIRCGAGTARRTYVSDGTGVRLLEPEA